MSERRDGAEEENMKLGKTFISSVFKHAVVCVCVCVCILPPAPTHMMAYKNMRKSILPSAAVASKKKLQKMQTKKFMKKAFFDGID